MAYSMRNVERYLEGGDWTSAVRECGSLLESVLHEIYKLSEPNLSSATKARICDWERRKGKKIQKFTLGDLTQTFQAAQVLTQFQNDFGRPLQYLLGADWRTLVRLRNKSSHTGLRPATRADASFFAAYVSAFLQELGWENFGIDLAAASTAIHPFDLFKDFDVLEKVVKPRWYDRSDQQGVVGNVLLHSIQPAYYLDKLELLQDYSRRVGKNPDFIPMANVLVDARTVVEGACAVYGGLKRQEGREYFEAVKTDLEVPLTTEIDEQQGSWPEAIRLDFLGLCLYHLHLDARKNDRSADAAAFLKNARQAFDSALDHFNRLAVPPLSDVAALWKGYALRNLGSVLADNGERELAGEYYKRALKERALVYQRLKPDCVPLIASQLLVEIELVKIDMANLEGKSEALAGSANRLLQMRQDLPSVWPHLEERLYESAIALNAPVVAEDVVLAAIEDRLYRLTGKKCAQLIRDEVRSGKVIHEVGVSRCRVPQPEKVNDCVPDSGSDN
jgi:tetratricopeptide (TPR) repeat protein